MIDESLFAGSEVHARMVEVAPGKTVELWFKELPGVNFVRFHQMHASQDDAIKAAAAARLVADCLCNPDGTPAMTYEKACTLKSKPLNAIFAAVLEVNGATSGKP